MNMSMKRAVSKLEDEHVVKLLKLQFLGNNRQNTIFLEYNGVETKMAIGQSPSVILQSFARTKTENLEFENCLVLHKTLQSLVWHIGSRSAQKIALLHFCTV